MIRLSTLSTPIRLFSTKVETFPRPVHHLRNMIKPKDIVGDLGDIKVVRARQDHIPLLLGPLEDFLKSEPTNQVSRT